MNLKNIFKDYVTAFNKLKHLKVQLLNMNDHQIFYIHATYIENLVLNFKSVNVELAKKIADNPSEYFPSTNFTVVIPHENFLGICHIFSDKQDESGFQYQPSLETGKFYSSFNNDNWDGFQQLFIYAILYSLNAKETFIGNTSSIMRMPNGRLDPKTISIISTKKYMSTYTNRFDTEIDWKHSWECIGHWRKCFAIGKDRDGEYNQIGKTWVNPCVKGKGELVKKIRVVK
jgi:hypothetical protein